MRAAFLVLLALAACDRAPEAAKPAGEPPKAAEAAKAAPAAPSYPPADAAWKVVPLAEGATPTATAEMPPTFRNAAGAIACPVMGMAIAKPEDAVSYVDHAGVRYFFCCDSCEKLFADEPAKYANGKYLADHRLDPTAAPSCGDKSGDATCGDEDPVEG